jgi:hypothetical protein
LPFLLATFGARSARLVGLRARETQPSHAEAPLRNTWGLRGAVAVARRGECEFVTKVRPRNQACKRCGLPPY